MSEIRLRRLLSELASLLEDNLEYAAPDDRPRLRAVASSLRRGDADLDLCADVVRTALALADEPGLFRLGRAARGLEELAPSHEFPHSLR
jgi:hypothetical protein